MWADSLPQWPQVTSRINCGGGDTHGFQLDLGYDTGTVDSTKDAIEVKVPNAAPEAIYQTERYGDFTYRIPVNPIPGGYTVRLHFVDFKFSSAGQRKFNVDINGTSVLSDFDIIAEGGAKDKAVVKDFPHIMPGPDSSIRIHFSKGSADDAEVAGLEVMPSGT